MKKDYLTITKKHRMENGQEGNGKIKSSTNIYINSLYNQIRWSNLCWREISLWENQGPRINHEKKSKTWMGNSTENADKISTKLANIKKKQRKNPGTIWNKKEKAKRKNKTINLGK